jgi:hypothetical protein
MHPFTMKLIILCLFASTISAFTPSHKTLSVRSVASTPSALKINLGPSRSTVLLATDNDVEEKEDETKKGFAAIKSAGRAGAISLFLWEAAFWIIAGER